MEYLDPWKRDLVSQNEYFLQQNWSLTKTGYSNWDRGLKTYTNTLHNVWTKYVLVLISFVKKKLHCPFKSFKKTFGIQFLSFLKLTQNFTFLLERLVLFLSRKAGKEGKLPLLRFGHPNDIKRKIEKIWSAPPGQRPCLQALFLMIIYRICQKIIINYLQYSWKLFVYVQN